MSIAITLAKSIQPFIGTPITGGGKARDEIVIAISKSIQREFDDLTTSLQALLSISPAPQNKYQTKAYDRAAQLIKQYKAD